jgi:hypothetical protein
MVTVDANAPPPMIPSKVSDANAAPPLGGYEQRTSEGIPLSGGEWTADEAKRIVLGDFNRAAADRATNYETKWQNAAAIYSAVRNGEKYWDGSKTPRANMQIWHAFTQVNALRPHLIDAICGADLDFDVEAASSGTTITQLHQVRALMQNQLKSLGGRVKFQSFRYCVDRMTEDGTVLGNGIWEWGWDGPRQEQAVQWKRIVEPEIAMGEHPMMPGMQIPMETGRTISYAQKYFKPEIVSKFYLDPVDLMDFYIDPNTRSTNVQQAGFCIRRKMMTIAELASYRGQEGFDIPDDITLYRLSQQKTFTEGDTTRQAIQSYRGVNYQPGQDQSVDPRLARVEVLRYWQRDHHVWLIGREHVGYNLPNQYQALPFLNWCYVNALGSFYGYSIPELLDSGQKLIKTLTDGRLDELNLILHPPFITKLGMARTQSKMKLRPGANWEAENPDKDVVRLEMGNVTQQAFTEVQLVENRDQKVTGITDLAVLGSPTAGGNSANRTATGVQAQTSASNSREQGLVANIEDQVLSPMLTQMWELICMFMDPQQILTILGPDGQGFQVDPVDVLNADPKFKLKTANNMKMRAAMQGGGLQTLTQYVLNPEIITAMGEQQQKTLDIEQFTEFYLDVYGVKAFNLFRPMTPQEMQDRQQRAQQAGMEKMQLQQARLGTMSQDAHERDETQIIVATLNALAQIGALNDILGVARDAEIKSAQILEGE